MSEIRHEELISAYLDGELSAEEQAQVESLLAADPQARRLHDELRALSGALQALPRLRAPENLASGVLRAAERAVLSGKTGAQHDGRATDPAQAPPAGSPAPPTPAGRFTWRTLAWPSLAVAAALMLMALNRDWFQQAELAQAPPRSAAPEAEPGEMAEADEAFAIERLDAGKKVDVFRSADFEPEDARRHAAPSAEMIAGERRPELRANRDDAERAAGERARLRVVDGLAASAGGRAPAEELALEGVLIVEVTVPAATLQSDAFKQILAEQNIHWEDETAAPMFAYGDSNANDRLGRAAQDDADSGEKKDAANQRRASADARANVATATRADRDLVYVEASPEQIEATLASLATRSEEFVSVNLRNSPGALPSLGDFTRESSKRAEEREADKLAAAGPPADAAPAATAPSASASALKLAEQKPEREQQAARANRALTEVAGTTGGGEQHRFPAGRAQRLVTPAEADPTSATFGLQTRQFGQRSVQPDDRASKSGAVAPQAARSRSEVADTEKPGAPPSPTLAPTRGLAPEPLSANSEQHEKQPLADTAPTQQRKQAEAAQARQRVLFVIRALDASPPKPAPAKPDSP